MSSSKTKTLKTSLRINFLQIKSRFESLKFNERVMIFESNLSLKEKVWYLQVKAFSLYFSIFLKKALKNKLYILLRNKTYWSLKRSFKLLVEAHDWSCQKDDLSCFSKDLSPLFMAGRSPWTVVLAMVWLVGRPKLRLTVVVHSQAGKPFFKIFSKLFFHIQVLCVL